MENINNRTTKSKGKKKAAFKPVIMIYAAVINLLAVVMLKLPEKLKAFLFSASIFLIVAVSLWRWTNLDVRYLIEWDKIIILYIILFIVLLLTSIDRRVALQEIRWNRFFWIGWYLCFSLIIITSFFHTIDKEYFIWSVMSILYFPLLFIVWQARDDYDTLFRTIAGVTVVCSFVFFLISVPANMIFNNEMFGNETFASYFLGVVGNPNSNGRIAIGFFAAGFYLNFTDREINIWAVISMAIAIALSIESICRTAELAIAMMIVFGWIYYVKISQTKTGVVIKQTLVSIVLLLIFTISFCILLKAVMSMDLYAYAATVQSPISPESYTELNALSNGRFELWRTYIQDINLFGHGLMDTSGLPEYYRWAHNNLLDILYISGSIAALGYLIWNLISLVFVVQCTFWKIMKRSEYLFVIVSVIGYFVEAMLEITIFPMTTGIVFMAFMGLALVSGEKNN